MQTVLRHRIIGREVLRNRAICTPRLSYRRKDGREKLPGGVLIRQLPLLLTSGLPSPSHTCSVGSFRGTSSQTSL